ncbi:MAG: hypothetical protein GY868_07965 [Deltaproteobacteria bacterium]|nr:hypothetical protein [Deltaproteobacteria bacterium]
MSAPLVLTSGRIIDGRGDLSAVTAAEAKLAAAGCATVTLHIDPLKAGWDTPLQTNHFRSGCAPIEALARAGEMLAQSACEAVVISGTDNLRSGFAGRTEQRRKLMNIYGDGCPLPEAYTQLAHAFIEKNRISAEAFKETAALLYDNYRRTAQRAEIDSQPDSRWIKPVTALFRGIDCANPFIDFRGKLILGTTRAADFCGIPLKKRIGVLGVGLGQTAGDGPEHINEIAVYTHLKKAFRNACSQAGINFAERFLQHTALLETYTCYPVVPMAFLLAGGIAATIGDIPRILTNYDVTVTGGMNIARAPWNNPALNALICMHHKLEQGPVTLGAVHGNGGLGARQGVAVLGLVEREPSAVPPSVAQATAEDER